MRTPEEVEERLDSIQIAIAELFGEDDVTAIDGMSVERIAVRLAQMRGETMKVVLTKLLDAHREMLAIVAVTYSKKVAT